MATLHSVEARFIETKSRLLMQQGQKALLDEQYALAKAQQEQAQGERELYEKTAALLLTVSGAARDLVRKKIEHLVTLGLTAITGDPYQFRVDMVQSAGQWNASFVVVNPNGVEVDPLDGSGGGIADICSMTLRIAILQMYEPTIEGPILLDENGKFISRDHIRTFIEFLQTLVEKTKRQIILVTHVPELAAGADRVFEVIPVGSTSSITQRIEDAPQL